MDCLQEFHVWVQKCCIFRSTVKIFISHKQAKQLNVWQNEPFAMSSHKGAHEQTSCDWKLTCKWPFWKINEVSECKKIIAFKKISPRGKSSVNGHAEWATNIRKHGSYSFPDSRYLYQSRDFWEEDRINRTDTKHWLQQHLKQTNDWIHLPLWKIKIK